MYSGNNVSGIMDYNSPNVAISRIVEHDVSPRSLSRLSLSFNHSKSLAINFVLVVRKIAQADLMNIRHKYRESQHIETTARLSKRKRVHRVPAKVMVSCSCTGQ